jgi:3-phenylpropionate/trans-cinnamate dioxygenase ferredoxin subunit
MARIKVASVAELPPGTARQVAIDNKRLAVFNVDGKYYAIDDTCTHRGAPLSEGECAGPEVTCPWHGARFDLQTGAALSPPASRGVACYRVEVVGDEIQVDLDSKAQC